MGGSEISLNTVMHENVKVYNGPACEFFFFEISLNFSKTALGSYSYKLYKFFKICKIG